MMFPRSLPRLDRYKAQKRHLANSAAVFAASRELAHLEIAFVPWPMLSLQISDCEQKVRKIRGEFRTSELVGIRRPV
jgi:hypothetical protein